MVYLTKKGLDLETAESHFLNKEGAFMWTSKRVVFCSLCGGRGFCNSTSHSFICFIKPKSLEELQPLLHLEDFWSVAGPSEGGTVIARTECFLFFFNRNSFAPTVQHFPIITLLFVSCDDTIWRTVPEWYLSCVSLWFGRLASRCRATFNEQQEEDILTYASGWSSFVKIADNWNTQNQQIEREAMRKDAPHNRKPPPDLDLLIWPSFWQERTLCIALFRCRVCNCMQMIS